MHKKAENMAVTEYKKNVTGGDNMRDEVHGHLENLQDDLDTLKYLLRTDSYSLDTNTLMGHEGCVQTHNEELIALLDYLTKLFNDTDHLNPFSLNNWNKPGLDFTDIMDVDKNVITDASPSSSRSLVGRRSSLDTPVYE